MISILFLPIFAAVSFAQSPLAGINLSGFEFGCTIDGSCNTSQIIPPLGTLGGGDGVGQMQHFTSDDQLNAFRIPVAWQYLVDVPGGPLNSTNFGNYDQLVQQCLALDITSYCIIDLHNYARFNGKIIGQDPGAPTNAEFADLWSQLAKYYAKNTNIIFGIMNEPHDLDVPTWGVTVQAAVTAIRTAGALSQMILLPGTNWARADTFVSSGSAAALSAVKNLDGTNTSLIFDVHKYLDIDNSGSHQDCVTDNVAGSFVPLAAYLKANGRQAILSETGAGNDTTCLTDLCSQLTYINNNPDVYLGYVGWAAGSFSPSYVLSETPTQGDEGEYDDNEITSNCIVGIRYNLLNPTSS